MTDRPKVRALKVCIACHGDKDAGLLVCWTCHYRMKRHFNGGYDPLIEVMMDLIEDGTVEINSERKFIIARKP